MFKAKLVKEIRIKDPETRGLKWVAIYKHENGGMFGVESDYLDKVFDNEAPVLVPDMFGIFKLNDGVLLND